MEQRKLRWGVVGSAGIAKRAFIPAVHTSEWGVVTAIASRDLETAKKTAEELQIGNAYGSYEALIADPQIDAVYIPLPNHLHREWTIRAAQAGKHVLCEKPLAMNAAEAEEMVGACKDAGVLLEEAFMYRHHPRYDQIREIIRSGEIGEIRGIRGAFTFNNAGDMKNVRYKREWGGGSIYDVGCYPICAARLILEQEPSAVTAQAFYSPEHGNVDMMAAGLIEFAGGVSLTFDCGMWASGRNTLEIVGSKGRIEVPSAFVTPKEQSHFYVIAGSERREVSVPEVNQYTIQADRFAKSVLNGEAQRFPGEDGILNMRIIDAALKSAEERVRVVLS